MAPRGLRILFQPLPSPNGCKIQPSNVCAGVLLWWRFAVSPITSELFLICADAAEDTCTLQWVSRFVHPPATCVHKALPAFRLFPEQTVWLLFSAGATVIAWTGVKAIFFLCFFQIPSVGKKHYSLRNLFKSMCQVLNSQASVAFCPKYFV